MSSVGTSSGLAMRTALHDAAGVLWAESGGMRVPRNYGDPAAEYGAARAGAIVVDRVDRVLLRVWGRDPVRMVNGLVTNDVAGAAEGRGVYAVMLSPKGRMQADMRVVRRDSDLLLETAAGALDGLTATLKKFVPPLFARYEDSSEELGVLGLFGPSARDIVVRVCGDAPVADSADESFVEAGGSIVMRTRLTGEPGGYDVIASQSAIGDLWQAAVAAGARPAGLATLDVLRIEAGTPVWGAELDDTVIPLEAGLRRRAISETKGCYTGQEVIVRILHRGHVNRHLRGLLLGDEPPPGRGAELVRASDGRVVGVITSACVSPLHGQTIGLGYVRREVEPPALLGLGGREGVEVRVVELPFPATG
jgi:tRNA-modifying protein YgfZ